MIFGEHHRLGLLEDGRILDIALAAEAQGVSAERLASYRDLQGLIELGQRGLDQVRSLQEKLRGSDQVGLWIEYSQAILQAPWPGQRLLLVGSNNATHMSEAYTHLGRERVSLEQAYRMVRDARPWGFWGKFRPIMGPGAAIRIPARAKGYFDFEAEPGIILGKQGGNIKAREIADYVWGVSLIADWSIRLPEWPPKPSAPFMATKNFDTSKSIGPCIVVEEIDLDDLQIETFVNGEPRQSFSCKEMVHSFGEILEYFSDDFTFFPGDAVSGGTGAGTALDQTSPHMDGSWPYDLYLKPGDVVEHKAEQIGSLISRIVA